MSSQNNFSRKGKIAGKENVDVSGIRVKLQGFQPGANSIQRTSLNRPVVTFTSSRPKPPSSLIGLLDDLTESTSLSEESIKYRHPHRG